MGHYTRLFQTNCNFKIIFRLIYFENIDISSIFVKNKIMKVVSASYCKREKLGYVEYAPTKVERLFGKKPRKEEYLYTPHGEWVSRIDDSKPSKRTKVQLDQIFYLVDF